MSFLQVIKQYLISMYYEYDNYIVYTSLILITLSKKVKNGIKDLSILWDIYKVPGYNKNNTIIVDDNSDVKKTGYCIQVNEFMFTNNLSENDKYLETLKSILDNYKNQPEDTEFDVNLSNQEKDYDSVPVY